VAQRVQHFASMTPAVRILAVDDDPSVAQAISYALASDDRKLAMAASVKEAMEKMAVADFDVVITDNNMPLLNGVELVRRLRQNHFPGKIVVLTAYLSEQLEREYSALAVDRMLPKPFNISELRRTIDALAPAA
jgi:CheY-like chemotaxis protein